MSTEGTIARCRERVSALAAAALGAAGGEEDLAALAGSVWAAVEGALAHRAPGTPAPACRPGCAACCTVNVGTLAVEGAAAAALLRRALGAPDAAALADRLVAFHDRVRWLEDRERIAERLACPLLDGSGRCLVHPARPLACRSVSSLDPDACRSALAEREEDGPGLVAMDVLQRALWDEAREAVALALGARGLDARCRDVSGMVGAFLADPALAARFLAGARVPLE